MYVDTPIVNPEVNIDDEKSFVISLDQGTTSSRSIVFDHQGQIVGMAQHEFTQIFPRAGWVEHDAKEILSTQLGTLAEVLTMEGISFSQVAAIGITNQRETTVVWDKETGEPVYNAIVWQCRRGAPLVDELIAQGKSDMIQAKTGLIPDAYYSASKVAWILDKVEGARQAAEEGKLLFGTIDTWLIWNLTQGKVHATDYTNASRTMLYNIHDFCWDQDLLDLFNIPASMLPEVRPSTGDFGRCTFMGGEPGIPITGVAGDQQSSLFGQCCFQAGQAKNTYGTGCFLLMNTGDRAVSSNHGLVTTLAADPSGKPVYALEGSVFVAGALIQWLRDGLKIIDSAAESQEIAESIDSTEGVYIVPAFTGLGAPYWDQDARGTIVGLTRGTERTHLVRAALEALAYQVQGVVDAMEQDAGIDLSALHVDGGASANDFLMQFQSNILDAEILRPQVLETTGLGAAYLAGLAVGFWKDVDELKANHAIAARFRPDMEEEVRQGLLAGWEDAVARTRSKL